MPGILRDELALSELGRLALHAVGDRDDDALLNPFEKQGRRLGQSRTVPRSSINRFTREIRPITLEGCDDVCAHQRITWTTILS